MNAAHSSKARFLRRLPIEIRLQIYKHVFHGDVFHLHRRSVTPTFIFPAELGRQRWIPPRIIVGDHPLFPRKLQTPEPPRDHINWTLVEMFRERRSKWAILLTCRQSYNEALEKFYHASTLSFDHPHVLLDLATKCLSKRHLIALRRLEVIWPCYLISPKVGINLDEHSQLAWDKLWYLVAFDMRITNLVVSIILDGNRRHLTLEAPWLRSLSGIRRIPECHIFVKPDHKRFFPRGTIDRQKVLADFSKLLQAHMRHDGGNCTVSIQDATDW